MLFRFSIKLESSGDAEGNISTLSSTASTGISEDSAGPALLNLGANIAFSTVQKFESPNMDGERSGQVSKKLSSRAGTKAADVEVQVCWAKWRV